MKVQADYYAKETIMSDDFEQQDVNLSERLKAWAGTDWDNAVNHPFTVQIGAGAVSDSVYSYYLIQDLYFVQRFIKALEGLIENAPDDNARERLGAFHDSINLEEIEYFERSLADLNISFKDIATIVPCRPIIKLSDYVLNISTSRNFYQGLTALLACEWIYETWAVRELKKPEPSRYHFAEWIRLHACPDFREFVDWMRRRVNRYEHKGSVADFIVLAMIFTRVCQLENDFWNHVINQP